MNKKTGGDAGDKWREGRPIRVCRGEKLAKHSKFAPEEGIRYLQREGANILRASVPLCLFYPSSFYLGTCSRLSFIGPTGTSQRLLLTPGGHPPHPSSNLDSLRGCLHFFSVFFVRHLETAHCHTIFYVCRHFVPCIHHSL